jgi:hypothetical protein
MTCVMMGRLQLHILPLFFWAAFTAPHSLSYQRAATYAAVLI